MAPLEGNLFPEIGAKPIAEIGASALLAALRKMLRRARSRIACCRWPVTNGPNNVPHLPYGARLRYRARL